MLGRGRTAWLVVPGMLLSLTGALRAQGTLDDVREEVRDGGGEEDHDDHDDDWLGDDPGDELFGAFLEDGLGPLFRHTLFLPWSVPRLLLADETFEPAGLARRPGRRGDPYWRPSMDGVLDGRKLAVRPSFELGTDFDDLERTGLGLVLDHSARLALEATWSRWREDLGAGGSDELDLGELSLVYRFAQGPRAAFWSGLGLNVLDDQVESDFGLDLTYGALFLPGERTSVELEADLGTLGDATLTHLGASVGWRLGPCELFAAYDRWEIGSAELPSYSLGLRGWF